MSTNSKKTHPKFGRVYNNGNECYNLHAEMSALLWAKPGDILEVFRFHKNGELAPSHPCSYCMDAIRKNKISSIHYYMNGKWIVEKI